jgi:predicted MFS family arabinose efflux permease
MPDQTHWSNLFGLLNIDPPVHFLSLSLCGVAFAFSNILPKLLDKKKSNAANPLNALLIVMPKLSIFFSLWSQFFCYCLLSCLMSYMPAGVMIACTINVLFTELQKYLFQEEKEDYSLTHKLFS